MLFRTALIWPVLALSAVIRSSWMFIVTILFLLDGQLNLRILLPAASSPQNPLHPATSALLRGI